MDLLPLPDGLKDLVLSGVSVVVVIYGLLEALKQAGLLVPKYAPLLAIGLGVGCSLANLFFPELTAVVILGIGLGVAASLGYAGFKKNATNAKVSEIERQDYVAKGE